MQKILKSLSSKLGLTREAASTSNTDDGLPAFLQTVRHVEPSYLMSLDDSGAFVSDRLLSIAIGSISQIRKQDLEEPASRFSDQMRDWVKVWPGEHYALLAAMVEFLQPSLVIEIGTFTGASSLCMKSKLQKNAKLITYDIVPWSQFPNTGLIASDFDERFEQRVLDISDAKIAEAERRDIENAELIFVDAAKDGRQEQRFIDLFNRMNFKKAPIVVFDDIRVINMLEIWRKIDHPKLDLTSFGHWSGTGVVEWQNTERVSRTYR